MSISRVFSATALNHNVVQQPKGNNAWVSTDKNTLTEFRIARKYGTVGLLGHNLNVESLYIPGNYIVLFYETNEVPQFEIYSSIEYFAFKAITPSSPYSEFQLCTYPYQPKSELNGILCTAGDVFKMVYAEPYITASRTLVLQTCFSINGDKQGGRLFIKTREMK